MPDPTASIPDVAVTINGQDLPARAYRDLLGVNVQNHLDGPSAFTLSLSAWNDERLDFGWADDDLFGIGGEVEIRLGYVGSLSTIIFGDISGMDITIGSEAPSLTVRGYDRRHRMQRGSNTRTFVKMKDSDIASQIAKDYGLEPQVEDSKIQHEFVTQNSQPDFQFLTKRAEAIGFEMVVEGKTLHFRPRQSGASASLTLQADGDLLDFSAQLSASNQASEVEVRAWNPKNKETFVGKASGDPQSSMGSVGGPAAAQQAFGKAALTITDRTASSQEEADRIAREQLERMALGFLQGNGTCIGRNDLRAGMVIELAGVGKRFSGAYYVTTTTHTYSSQAGYKTSFSLRRNAT